MRAFFALIPFLATLAVANEHDACQCEIWLNNNWVYTWELTADACDQNWQAMQYIGEKGRCFAYGPGYAHIKGHEQYDGSGIQGDQFEGYCKDGARKGYRQGHDRNSKLLYAEKARSICFNDS